MATGMRAEVELSINDTQAKRTMESSAAELNRILGRVGKKQVNFNVNSRSFTQPLGRITGSANEFTKSLEASNARVIAFGASVGIINGISDAFKNLVAETIRFEKTLSDVNVVLNASNASLQQFGQGLFDVAKNTSQSFGVAAEAALEFSRQGLTMEEVLKRTNDALTLTRLTSLKAADAVSGLTAAVNAFADVGLTTTQVIDKLAAVDVKFAVSSEDLINALERTGAVAIDAGVELDSLIGLVTSLQQTTARGGSVIGNGLKTIFTRIQRPQSLKQIEELDIAVRNLSGAVLPADKILINIAKSFDTLTASQKSNVVQFSAGIFQANVFRAALRDLSKDQSIQSRATEVSASAAGEAAIKNAQLNKTIAALASQSGSAIQELAGVMGELMVKPEIGSFLELFKGSIEGITDMLGGGEDQGSTFAKGLVAGIGNVLTGPAAIAFGAVFVKLFMNIAKFAQGSLKDVLDVVNKKDKIKKIEESILETLSKNKDIQESLNNLEGDREQQGKFILKIVEAQTNAMREQEKLAKQLARPLLEAGVKTDLTVGGKGPVDLDGDGIMGSFGARGVLPSSARKERREASRGGYSAGAVDSMSIKGLGQVVYNKAEKVKQFPGMQQPAIMPPQGSRAGSRYKEAFSQKHGFDPYASGGFVPNFASLNGSELILSQAKMQLHGMPRSAKTTQALRNKMVKGEMAGLPVDVSASISSLIGTGEGSHTKKTKDILNFLSEHGVESITRPFEITKLPRMRGRATPQKTEEAVMRSLQKEGGGFMSTGGRDGDESFPVDLFGLGLTPREVKSGEWNLPNLIMKSLRLYSDDELVKFAERQYGASPEMLKGARMEKLGKSARLLQGKGLLNKDASLGQQHEAALKYGIAGGFVPSFVDKKTKPKDWEKIIDILANAPPGQFQGANGAAGYLKENYPENESLQPSGTIITYHLMTGVRNKNKRRQVSTLHPKLTEKHSNKIEKIIKNFEGIQDSGASFDLRVTDKNISDIGPVKWQKDKPTFPKSAPLSEIMENKGGKSLKGNKSNRNPGMAFIETAITGKGATSKINSWGGMSSVLQKIGDPSYSLGISRYIPYQDGSPLTKGILEKRGITKGAHFERFIKTTAGVLAGVETPDKAPLDFLNQDGEAKFVSIAKGSGNFKWPEIVGKGLRSKIGNNKSNFATPESFRNSLAHTGSISPINLFQVASKGLIPNFADNRNRQQKISDVLSDPSNAGIKFKGGALKPRSIKSKNMFQKMWLESYFKTGLEGDYQMLMKMGYNPDELLSLRSHAEKGGEVNILGKGFVPNFANPLKEAIAREEAAGIPKSQIRVEQSGQLRGPGNPMGLAVTNKRDEPGGVGQGIRRARSMGMDPRRHGAASGMIPNFADGDEVKIPAALLKELNKEIKETQAALDQDLQNAIKSTSKTIADQGLIVGAATEDSAAVQKQIQDAEGSLRTEKSKETGRQDSKLIEGLEEYLKNLQNVVKAITEKESGPQAMGETIKKDDERKPGLIAAARKMEFEQIKKLTLVQRGEQKAIEGTVEELQNLQEALHESEDAAKEETNERSGGLQQLFYMQSAISMTNGFLEQFSEGAKGATKTILDLATAASNVTAAYVQQKEFVNQGMRLTGVGDEERGFSFFGGNEKAAGQARATEARIRGENLQARGGKGLSSIGRAGAVIGKVTRGFGRFLPIVGQLYTGFTLVNEGVKFVTKTFKGLIPGLEAGEGLLDLFASASDRATKRMTELSETADSLKNALGALETQEQEQIELRKLENKGTSRTIAEEKKYYDLRLKSIDTDIALSKAMGNLMDESKTGRRSFERINRVIGSTTLSMAEQKEGIRDLILANQMLMAATSQRTLFQEGIERADSDDDSRRLDALAEARGVQMALAMGAAFEGKKGASPTEKTEALSHNIRELEKAIRFRGEDAKSGLDNLRFETSKAIGSSGISEMLRGAIQDLDEFEWNATDLSVDEAKAYKKSVQELIKMLKKRKDAQSKGLKDDVDINIASRKALQLSLFNIERERERGKHEAALALERVLHNTKLANIQSGILKDHEGISTEAHIELEARRAANDRTAKYEHDLEESRRSSIEALDKIIGKDLSDPGMLAGDIMTGLGNASQAQVDKALAAFQDRIQKGASFGGPLEVGGKRVSQDELRTVNKAFAEAAQEAGGKDDAVLKLKALSESRLKLETARLQAIFASLMKELELIDQNEEKSRAITKSLDAENKRNEKIEQQNQQAKELTEKEKIKNLIAAKTIKGAQELHNLLLKSGDLREIINTNLQGEADTLAVLNKYQETRAAIINGNIDFDRKALETQKEKNRTEMESGLLALRQLEYQEESLELSEESQIIQEAKLRTETLTAGQSAKEAELRYKFLSDYENRSQLLKSQISAEMNGLRTSAMLNRDSLQLKVLSGELNETAALELKEQETSLSTEALKNAQLASNLSHLRESGSLTDMANRLQEKSNKLIEAQNASRQAVLSRGDLAFSAKADLITERSGAIGETRATAMRAIMTNSPEDALAFASALEETNKQMGNGTRAVDRLRSKMAELDVSAKNLGADLVDLGIDGVRSGFKQLLEDIGSGAKSAGDAWRDFGLGMAKTLLDRITDHNIDRIVKDLTFAFTGVDPMSEAEKIASSNNHLVSANDKLIAALEALEAEVARDKKTLEDKVVKLPPKDTPFDGKIKDKTDIGLLNLKNEDVALRAQSLLGTKANPMHVTMVGGTKVSTGPQAGLQSVPGGATPAGAAARGAGLNIFGQPVGHGVLTAGNPFDIQAQQNALGLPIPGAGGDNPFTLADNQEEADIYKLQNKLLNRRAQLSDAETELTDAEALEPQYREAELTLNKPRSGLVWKTYEIVTPGDKRMQYDENMVSLEEERAKLSAIKRDRTDLMAADHSLTVPQFAEQIGLYDDAIKKSETTVSELAAKTKNFNTESDALNVTLSDTPNIIVSLSKEVEELERAVQKAVNTKTLREGRQIPTPVTVAQAPKNQGGGIIQHFSDGGFVKGPGGKDKVPAMLTAGEFVLPKKDVNNAFNFMGQNVRGRGDTIEGMRKNQSVSSQSQEARDILAAEGGKYVQKFSDGGFVKGPGGKDKVPAMLTAGEFVIPKKEVNRAFNFMGQNVRGSGDTIEGMRKNQSIGSQSQEVRDILAAEGGRYVQKFNDGDKVEPTKPGFIERVQSGTKGLVRMAVMQGAADLASSHGKKSIKEAPTFNMNKLNTLGIGSDVNLKKGDPRLSSRFLATDSTMEEYRGYLKEKADYDVATTNEKYEKRMGIFKSIFGVLTSAGIGVITSNIIAPIIGSVTDYIGTKTENFVKGDLGLGKHSDTYKDLNSKFPDTKINYSDAALADRTGHLTVDGNVYDVAGGSWNDTVTINRGKTAELAHRRVKKAWTGLEKSVGEDRAQEILKSFDNNVGLSNKQLDLLEKHGIKLNDRSMSVGSAIDFFNANRTPIKTQKRQGGGSIPAMLTAGEGYIPEPIAKRIGYNNLSHMNNTGTMPIVKGTGGIDNVGPVSLNSGDFIMKKSSTNKLLRDNPNAMRFSLQGQSDGRRGVQGYYEGGIVGSELTVPARSLGPQKSQQENRLQLLDQKENEKTDSSIEGSTTNAETTNNININISIDKSGAEVESQEGGEDSYEKERNLSMKIKGAVLEVIREEKRIGGELS